MTQSIKNIVEIVNQEQWEDWRWQFANRLRTAEEISKYIELTESEKQALNANRGFAVGITPYYLSLIDVNNPNCPIRKQAIPNQQELSVSAHELADPLAEDCKSPAANLIHRYSDRVLIIVTETCHMYCRHCTRRRRVGFREAAITPDALTAIVSYIKNNAKIRDVLISGGDPLTLSDIQLEKIIKAIREIEHVEVIRIGTRAPVTNPYRVTDQLVNMLKKYHPLWINVQFNHPTEITAEAAKASAKLANAGIPLGNQTVLLKGVNNSIEIQKQLVHKLVKNRIRPYYLYQCDLAEGLEHFRTPINRGIEIMEKLQGHTSGFAVPLFVIDAPGGGGKIPVLPQYVLYQTPEKIVLRNYEGKIFTYPEPNNSEKEE
ncbi:MAG: lysine 2,3-aminomutase [Firmicutes bacterium]|nr:lysine 2,3-aminomutase [Bacillota bacterium]